LKQPQFAPVAVEDQVIAIFAGVRGYLDTVKVNDIGRYERQLLSELKAKHPDLVEAIRTDREIKPATEEKLKGFLDAFTKSFA
jgi:F-type H+-transporting ATPase subunit alpha